MPRIVGNSQCIAVQFEALKRDRHDVVILARVALGVHLDSKFALNPFTGKYVRKEGARRAIGRLLDRITWPERRQWCREARAYVPESQVIWSIDMLRPGAMRGPLLPNGLWYGIHRDW